MTKILTEEEKKEQVKNFFDKEIEEFDFSDEVLTNEHPKISKTTKEEYTEESDVLKKYILYKTKFKNSDPDVNNGLLKSIYKELWDSKHLKDCISNDCTYFSDTMTSAQGLINNFYIQAFKYDHPKATKHPQISKNKMAKILKDETFKKYFLDGVKIEIKDKIYDSSEIITNFIKHYHTLGNYIPVPDGFNGARSGSFSSHDMWDITLMQINKYYETASIIRPNNEKEEALLELLHYKNTINATQSWLDSFGKGNEGWKNFIEKNYLQDYIDDKDNWPIKKEFLEIHRFDCPKIEKFVMKKPDKEISQKDILKTYLEYFELLTKTIIDRTKRLQKEYKNKK